MKFWQTVDEFPNIDLKKFEGIPFRWRGRNPLEGLDCYGFISYVHEQVTGRPIKILENLYEDCHQHSQGARKIQKTLENLLGEPHQVGKPLDLAVIGRPTQEALSILLQKENQIYIAYMTTMHRSMVKQLNNYGYIKRGFWGVSEDFKGDPKNLEKDKIYWQKRYREISKKYVP